jgi:hypothetical protein
MDNLLLLFIVSVITSVIGSFIGFVLAVHFDLEAKWEQRKYERHKRHLEGELRHSYDVPLSEQRQREKFLDKCSTSR